MNLTLGVKFANFNELYNVNELKFFLDYSTENWKFSLIYVKSLWSLH